MDLIFVKAYKGDLWNPYSGASFYKLAKLLVSGFRSGFQRPDELQDIGNAILKAKKIKARIGKRGYTIYGNPERARAFIAVAFEAAKLAAARKTGVCDEAEMLAKFFEFL